VSDVLDAAHILPYRGKQTNHVSNGLLLRTDLHTLFDLGLLAIDAKSLKVWIAGGLRDTEYGKLHGRKLRQPRQRPSRPNVVALRRKFAERST
jgi:predicted restriction endonuclease